MRVMLIGLDWLDVVPGRNREVGQELRGESHIAPVPKARWPPGRRGTTR